MKLLYSKIVMVLVAILPIACKKDVKIEIVEQTSNADISIRGISVVDESIVWVSGSRGVFARTTDGGKNWKWDSIPGAGMLDFRDIKAFNADTALVLSAGLPAKIFKTSDGGKSWRQTYSDTTQGVFFDAMDFWNAKSGIALSDPLPDGCLMIETHDGGETWTRIPPQYLPRMMESEAHFAASGTCLLTIGESGICFVSGGSAARVFISPDGGKTWKISQSPIMQGKPSQGIFSVAIFDAKTAYIIGGDYQNPKINQQTAAYSTNGGQTWKLPKVAPPAGFNSCVKYIPKTSGRLLMAVGTEGIHLSANKGKVWTLHDTVPYHTLEFEKTGKYGWAAGSNGRVARIKID
jgi:photosystem II stability/assembly factor-like uncharacterized protein